MRFPSVYICVFACLAALMLSSCAGPICASVSRSGWVESLKECPRAAARRIPCMDG
jgi:hypothetical protein